MKKLYSPFFLRAAFVVLLMLSFVRGWGQMTFTSGAGLTQTQNFDGLPTNTASNNINAARLGQDWFRSDGSTQSQALTGNIIVGQNTASTPNGMYNCGVSAAATSTDRAVGGVTKSTVQHRLGVRLVNSVGTQITQFNLDFKVEKYRNGGSNTVTGPVLFEYSTDATSLNTGSWTAISALDLVEPSNANTDSTVGIDGNATGNFTAISGSISGLTLANSSGIWIRWRDTDVTGADAVLALDDVTITAITTATPTLTVSATSVTAMDYIFGNGASTPAKTFTVTGGNLSPAGTGNNVIYVSSLGGLFEYSTDNITFTEDFTSFTFTGSSFSKIIYVRLKAGLSVNNYSDVVDIGYYNDNNSPSNIEKTVALSGEVTAPPSPTISLGTFTTTAMTYPFGTGPSASQNASVSGSNLTNDITITSSNTSQWEVSKTGVDGSWGNSVTYTRTGTTIGTGNNIYVRLKSGLAVSPYSGMLTASSTGAVDKTYTLSGEVFQPAVIVSNNTFTQFTYAEGQGPSANQSFVVSGSNLASDITINVPSARWEIFTNEASPVPVASLVLNKTASNGVSNTTIYIRLKAGLSQGSYLDNNGLEVLSASTITQTKNLDGLVTEPKAELEVRGVFTTLAESNVIPNGDTTPMFLDNTEFAAQNIGNSQTKTFRLRNVGGLLLSVSSITVSNTTDFSVTSSVPYNIAGASYADFTITFQPQSMGVRTGLVTIANTDLTDNPYTFTVQGLGENAEIEVTGNNVVIPNGNTTISAADNTLIGSANGNTANPTTIAKTFVIHNTGNVALNASAITIDGGDVSQFEITPASINPIAAGATGTITVTFKPTSSGVKNTTVKIANNDLTDNENPYTFAVQGNAVDYIVCEPGGLGPLEIIALQDFETPAGAPVWNYTNTGGSIAGGTATAIVGGNNATVNKFIGARSFQVAAGTGVLNFNINTSNYQDIELNFRLGSFSGKAGNGADESDNIKVSLSTDGINFIDELLIKGQSANMRWSFGAIGSISKIVNNALVEFSSGTGDAGISSITLSNLPNVTNLYVRITAFNNNSDEIWAIENVTLKGKVLSGIAEKTWNGVNWIDSNNVITTAPTSTQKAIFANDYNSASNGGSVSACACEIQSTKTVTIGADDVLDIQDNINNAGSLVIESDGNLIQHNDLASNTGEITLKRDSKMKRGNYTYWSSPVNGQNLKEFSPGTLNNRFYTYNEGIDLFEVIAPSNDFEANGKGYSIRASNAYVGTAENVFTGTFVGTPNNGEKTIAVTKTANGNNLIGNPYPSNIDFRDLVTDNPTVFNAGAEAIAYFWTNLNPNPVMQGSNYPNGQYFNNYATLNMSGGVPATLVVNPNDPTQNQNGQTPTYFIKPGQGFIIKVAASGDLTFRNKMRKVGNGSVFFNYNQRSEEQTDRFWISLKSPMGALTTQLIAYLPIATNGFDGQGYDAKIGTLGADAFYSKIENDKFAIQGRGSFAVADKVDLGTNHYAAGVHTITLGKKEGIFANGQHVYLKDKHTNTITDLTADNYVFNAVAGNTENRFEIVYENDLVLGTDNQVRKNLIIYRNGDEFIIKSNDDKITEVELYDSVGRLIISTKPNATEARINVSHLSNAFYVLKIDQNGKVSSKKIIK